MRLQKKIRNRSRLSRGRAKQRIGRATGNRRMRAEGLTDRISGGVRKFGEDIRKQLKVASRGIQRTIGR